MQRDNISMHIVKQYQSAEWFSESELNPCLIFVPANDTKIKTKNLKRRKHGNKTQ